MLYASIQYKNDTLTNCVTGICIRENLRAGPKVMIWKIDLSSARNWEQFVDGLIVIELILSHVREPFTQANDVTPSRSVSL